MTLAKGSFGVVVTALCLFIAVEAWLAFAHPLARLPVATMEQGELFNSINCIKNEVRESNHEPYMVLLGSSLMVAPVVQAESQFRKHPIKRFFERRATVCEDRLNSLIVPSDKQAVMVFNGAVGGGMASDDFFVARELLQSKDSPAAIVCGVAPRDFQDNLVPGTYSTSAFQVLANCSDLGQLWSDKNLTADKKFDVAFGRVSSLWRNRAEVKSYFGLLSKKLIEKVCPFIVFDKYGPTLALAAQKAGVFPEEVKGTPMAYPGFAIDHYDSPKTCQQYMRSYNPIDKRMIDEQFAYFDRMLELAGQRGVEVLVVNMPLSQSNKELMPPGFYACYLTRLKDACARRHIHLADYNSAEWDANNNFIDTVHIRPEKSSAFVESLMKFVADSPLALALEGSQKRRIGAAASLQAQ
ncbi:MAG: hypothetical protein IT342_11165 [Candidatus Melainabacteria bacterium]|nr:hypothetical protein [Candidatus Melainabacteria bacterium]